MSISTLIIFLPLTLLMALALITRKMAEPMVAAALLAMLILHKTDFLNGTIDYMYGALSNSSYQFVLIILAGFGGMVKIFQESGALNGFGDWIAPFASGKKKPLILAWIMSGILFVDDYLSNLTVTFSLKDVTDRNGIPREHLAFQANAIDSCFCVILPFSSWVGFTIGLISDYGGDFNSYLKAIPFMFYPMLIIVCVLLLDLGIVPKVGHLKRAYERVEAGGPAFIEEEHGANLVNIELSSTEKRSSALNVIIPLFFMILGVMIFDKDLAHGLFLALLVQFVMYTTQKIMTIGEFFEHFLNGAMSMAGLAVIICFGFMLSAANKDMGLFDMIIGGVGAHIPVHLLPLFVFLIVGFSTFATAGCWTMQLICIPIFLPLAQSLGVPYELIIGPVMSGVSMGYTCCLYADSAFMTSAGSGVTNFRIIHTTMPYAIVCIILTCIAYFAAGFVFL